MVLVSLRVKSKALSTADEAQHHLLTLLVPLFLPSGPPCCRSNAPDALLPQGFCTDSPLRLGILSQ